jgi:hypothetical protein
VEPLQQVGRGPVREPATAGSGRWPAQPAHAPQARNAERQCFLRAPEPREGTPSPRLGEPEFLARFLCQFPGPAYDLLRGGLARIAAAAWEAYAHQRKSPRTREAGPGFADPAYDLA